MSIYTGNKAEQLRSIATEANRVKNRRNLTPIYMDIVGCAEAYAKEGELSYKRTLIDVKKSGLSALEVTESVNHFKEDFPFLNEMLEEDGFEVNTNLFTEDCPVREYYLEIKW